MKTLKNTLSKTVYVIALLTILSACKKEDKKDSIPGSVTDITEAIASANELYTEAVEGKMAGNYAVGSKAEFKKAIDLATLVKDNGTYNQREVNNATANLNRAITAFQSRIIQDVSADNLIAQWRFTGNADDVSGNGHNGTFMTGIIGPGTAPVDGKTLPKLIADRFNEQNSALEFDNGAYVEVPFTADLNPKAFTISLWIRRRVTFADNYMLSLNTYNGFKFQLQGNNFLFLTIHADNGYKDVDSNPGVIPENAWTFATVSYTNGTMKFYINDKLVKTVPVTGTPVTLSTPVNLVIGQSLPKSILNFTDQTSPFYYWGAAYFKGDLDDIRFYNKALSDAEVLSIYTMEKPD
ncbi:LamG domain-containing protein [Mucilaginibacter limnophilus]|uniref:LamG domain-containing protein n=1 Tax=Mucilaginibacter limnophilus TaxID=1932778 RepID=A0A437MSQ9_9SPHI|nr:LamG domain-containing protein [Mucilaginibacter limnophilus]RVU00691.1 LamG domain-containing protein [Mucilaginibacter limnophilus]